MTYDNAGRLLTKQFPATAESFTLTWDQVTSSNVGIGRLTTAAGQGGNAERRYNALGQVTQEKKVVDGVA